MLLHRTLFLSLLSRISYSSVSAAGTVTSFQSKLSALSFTTTIEKELGLDAEAEKVVLDDSNVDDCASYPRARALWAYNDDSRDDVVVLDKGEIVTVIEQSNDQVSCAADVRNCFFW